MRLAHSPPGFFRVRHTNVSGTHYFSDVRRTGLTASGLGDLAPPLRIAGLEDAKSAHGVADLGYMLAEQQGRSFRGETDAQCFAPFPDRVRGHSEPMANSLL